MRYVEPRRCEIDLDQGRLTNAAGRYQKALRDLDGLYADAAAFAALCAKQADRVVYEVTDVKPEQAEGGLIFGVTRMLPGRVGDEFFMTRGHIHARPDRPEIYCGLKGSGLMLLESPHGDIRIVEVGPQGICYVPPYWIHRSVNTGSGDLVMSFSYPADAGQDYGIIERSGGMRSRIVADGDGWREVTNPSYRARTAGEIARILDPRGSDSARTGSSV